MPPTAATHRSRLIACLAIVYIVWGSSYLATNLGVHRLPPFLFAGIRFVIGGLLLCALAYSLGRRVLPRQGDWGDLWVMALLSIVLSNGFNVWAMQWVPSNQAALLNVSSAFWIPIFGLYGARGHPIALRAGIGLALGFFGTLAILWPRDGLATSYFGPQLGILIGCMGWAAGTIYFRNAAPKLDILAFTGLQMLLGGIVLTAGGFALGEAAAWNWSPVGLAAMAYLIVFSSCLAYAAYAWLTHNTTPARVATYGYVNPAIATLLGWLVLGETLSGLAIAGMIVILAGVVLVNWPDPVPTPESPG
jgi:drug/metabolite transporter (DMT)-like permease